MNGRGRSPNGPSTGVGRSGRCPSRRGVRAPRGGAPTGARHHDGDPPVGGEAEKRTDAIHGVEHSKAPPARTDGADDNEISRRRPIFPGGCPPSIFGAGELNFRVRDGNGWCLSASVTGIDLQFSTCASPETAVRVEGGSVESSWCDGHRPSLPNAIQQRASRVN